MRHPSRLKTCYKAINIAFAFILLMSSCAQEQFPKLLIQLEGVSTDTMYVQLYGDIYSQTDTISTEDKQTAYSLFPDTARYNRALVIYNAGKSFQQYNYVQNEGWQRTEVRALPPMPMTETFEETTVPSLWFTDGNYFRFPQNDIELDFLVVWPDTKLDSASRAAIPLPSDSNKRYLLVLTPNEKTADSVAKTYGSDWLVASDSTGSVSQFLSTYRIERLPSLVVIDSNRVATRTHLVP